MHWSRLAAFSSSLAALVLAPAIGHTGAGGEQGASCESPLTWEIGFDDFGGAPEGDIDRGPVHVSLGYPNGNAYDFVVTAKRRWRVCEIHGVYKGGDAWSLAGTVGSADQKSFAARLFPKSGKRRMGTFVINYARRSSSDGDTCATARARYYGNEGDTGARMRLVTEQEEYRYRYSARWHLGPNSRLCYVKGWAFAGKPFTVRGGGDGSHPMDRFRSRGNHETPIAYLLVAFRR